MLSDKVSAAEIIIESDELRTILACMTLEELMVIYGRLLTKMHDTVNTDQFDWYKQAANVVSFVIEDKIRHRYDSFKS
jgi:hypothetical protein